MKRDFAALHGEFDLLVCGGGIYGAWTAFDAALRGLRVALVDQGDWAGATSSASSKLIHGGLRYLETFDLKLVKKALAERGRLLAHAPHRVWPLRFGVPVYGDSRNGRWKLQAGLTLYDLLARDPDAHMKHRYFNRRDFSARFPALADGQLRGGFTYADAQTDDARLVLELVHGAQLAGAVCVNYCRLEETLEEAGRACSARLHDGVSGAHADVCARQIVFAAGAWTGTLAQGQPWCRLSKGVHLVLPGLPGGEALLLTAKSDGRVFFLIPWYGRTLLGTTDTDYRDVATAAAVQDADIDYLLQAANDYLGCAWTRRDVIGSYAGLRVLRHSGDASPSAVSRDWELKTAHNGAHYSVGGKLTSAREDAARIVDRVCAQLGEPRPCATRQRDLPWKPAPDFVAWRTATAARALALGIDAESAHWLMHRHGSRIESVFDLAARDAWLARRVVDDVPLIHADLHHCAAHEMVVHLDDLLRRRLPLLILARLPVAELHRIAVCAAVSLGWDEARLRDETARLRS
ncbi:MAG: glycerol-3-phosphate dehydrogenase/oxidase [Gallionella sp.]|nr:glycerol-3-phosphate dehydrogenase/oxidase [Gallionella sp.]